METSLKQAGNADKLCFLHYPPRYRGYVCQEILDLLHAYDVKACYYGHLHGDSHKLALQGQSADIEYWLAAADYLNFRPLKVMD